MPKLPTPSLDMCMVQPTLRPRRTFGNRRPLTSACLSFALLVGVASSWAADPNQWVTGITEAVHDTSLSSSVIGIVRSRPKQEGSQVKQGEPLVELDNRLEEIEVSRKLLIRDHAKSELDRLKGLAAKSSLSTTQEELDKKKAEFEIATADYEFALEQLHRRQIVAPFNGVIAEYFLKVGEGCQALQPLVRLVDPAHCHLVVSVDAKIAYYMKPGESAQLEIEAGRESVSVPGKIEFVAPVADPASGLMKVKVLFDNTDGRLRPGVSGRLLLTKQGDAK